MDITFILILIYGIFMNTLAESIRMLPFLFLTYLLMEYLEHRAGDRMQNAMRKSGKWGPFLGSFLGVFPQCGFSAAASGLYAGRVISLGTLMAVYLSTSDEMLPILISRHVGINRILKILAIKVIVGMAAGFVIDLIMRKSAYDPMHDPNAEIRKSGEDHHDHQEKGILRLALRHTLEIFLYILLISFILDIIVHFLGYSFLGDLILNRPFISEMAAGLIGLIPNCASSIVITQLYLENAGVLQHIVGPMISGLLTGTGVGILVLLRANRKPAENIKIIALLYVIGVIAGILIGQVVQYI